MELKTDQPLNCLRSAAVLFDCLFTPATNWHLSRLWNAWLIVQFVSVWTSLWLQHVWLRWGTIIDTEAFANVNTHIHTPTHTHVIYSFHKFFFHCFSHQILLDFPSHCQRIIFHKLDNLRNFEMWNLKRTKQSHISSVRVATRTRQQKAKSQSPFGQSLNLEKSTIFPVYPTSAVGSTKDRNKSQLNAGLTFPLQKDLMSLSEHCSSGRSFIQAHTSSPSLSSGMPITYANEPSVRLLRFHELSAPVSLTHTHTHARTERFHQAWLLFRRHTSFGG